MVARLKQRHYDNKPREMAKALFASQESDWFSAHRHRHILLLDLLSEIGHTIRNRPYDLLDPAVQN